MPHWLAGGNYILDKAHPRDHKGRMDDILAPRFIDPVAARKHLEALRWPDGAECPHCGLINATAVTGGREGLPPSTGLVLRAQRAHLNMLENLAIFAIFVIVAQLTGKSNATTALGTTLFFWARLLYAVVYLAGIPWVRTAVWTVSFVGIVMVGSQLL